MTPQQVQQLAEKEYPTERTDCESYLSRNEVKEKEQAAFLNGLSKAHMWQSVSEDWKPEDDGTYWISNGIQMDEAYYENGWIIDDSVGGS